MDGTFTLIIEYVNKILLSKLSKEYHEDDFHPEYHARNSKLEEDLPKLKRILECADFTQHSERELSALSCLILLYLELQTAGPWNTGNKPMQYAVELNQIFANKNKINLNQLMQNNQYKCQVIFDKCIQELHKKLTLNDFKKYPTLIEVYCIIIRNVANYKIKLNPVTVLPVALLLIDDYITDNKVKGLLSCTAVLQCLTSEDFTVGNYYEVIYNSLNKNIVEKDKHVTHTLFQCFLQFLNVVPPNVKSTKLDDIFSNIVDQLHTESNLYRKADCFNFLTKVIGMHGIHCVKKKLFKDVIHDNIDICSDQSVSEILLLHVLECLEMWIRHCWCVWKLTSDYKILSSLFKILYTSKDEITKLRIQNLILTLLKLCAKEEQMVIVKNFDKRPKCTNEDFVMRLDVIKKAINNY